MRKSNIKTHTLSSVNLKDGTRIEFWHNYKTTRGVRNQCERFSRDLNTSVKSVNYRIKGDFIK